MNVLKVSLYQTQAVYRNPISSEVVETYPLPPPSTVIGLLSTITKKPLTINDINIAISGSYDSLVRDYQWYKKQSITKPYPILVHVLYGVELTLHITTYDNDELLCQIKDAFERPTSYLYLGRAEDLIKIISVDTVTLETRKSSKYDSVDITRPAYVRMDEAKAFGGRGVPYQLATFMTPKLITIQSGKKHQTKMIRDFEWESYYYFDKYTSFEPDDDITLLHDGDDYVCWSMQNQPR